MTQEAQVQPDSREAKSNEDLLVQIEKKEQERQDAVARTRRVGPFFRTLGSLISGKPLPKKEEE